MALWASVSAPGHMVSLSAFTGCGRVRLQEGYGELPLFPRAPVGPYGDFICTFKFLGSWQLCRLSRTAQNLSRVRDQTPV